MSPSPPPWWPQPGATTQEYGLLTVDTPADFGSGGGKAAHPVLTTARFMSVSVALSMVCASHTPGPSPSKLSE